MLLLAASGIAHAEQPILLDAGMTAVPLSARISYRHDAFASDGASEAFRRARDGEYVPLPDGNPSLVFQQGAYWAKPTCSCANTASVIR